MVWALRTRHAAKPQLVSSPGDGLTLTALKWAQVLEASVVHVTSTCGLVLPGVGTCTRTLLVRQPLCSQVVQHESRRSRSVQSDHATSCVQRGNVSITLYYGTCTYLQRSHRKGPSKQEYEYLKCSQTIFASKDTLRDMLGFRNSVYFLTCLPDLPPS